MAVVQIPRLGFIVAFLLVAVIAIWVARASGSDRPVQAAPAPHVAGAESSWIEYEGNVTVTFATNGIDKSTPLPMGTQFTGSVSVDMQTALYRPVQAAPAPHVASAESSWIEYEGNVTVTFATNSIDKSTPLPMDTQFTGSVSADMKTELANPSNHSDGQSISVPMIAFVVPTVSKDSDDGVPTP